jgi:hypothetical protein
LFGCLVEERPQACHNAKRAGRQNEPARSGIAANAIGPGSGTLPAWAEQRNEGAVMAVAPDRATAIIPDCRAQTEIWLRRPERCV